MAIQVIPNQPSFGAQLGSTLGTGLGQGLSMLAQNKMGEIQMQKKAKAWEGIGLDPQMANFIVQQPEWLQKEWVRRLEGLGQQQGQQQMAGQDGQQQPQRPLFGKSVSGSSDIQRQKLQQARDIADEKKNEPFLKGLAEDYRNAQALRSKAKSMLENLQKNKAKFPHRLVGKAVPDWAYGDKDVRKYLADSTSLVTALANSRKGQPTNFKIKFEQLSKPDLSMPHETQVELLNDIIKNTDNVFKANKLISRQKELNQGKVPGDIRERLIASGLEDLGDGEGINQNSTSQFQAGQELDELPKASSVPSGTEVEYGKDILVSDGTSWKKRGK